MYQGINMKEKLEIQKGKNLKEFYGSNLYDALKNCGSECEEILYMPQLLELKISALNDSKIFQNWYSTPSIKVTGRTKQGKPVVVYAHISDYFSNQKNIKKSINKGLINGAGYILNKDFMRLLELEDNKKVFVVDYYKLKSSTSGIIPLEKALEHPQTIPFCGSKELAEKYLGKYKEVYGAMGKIYGEGIGVFHCDDLYNSPLARPLVIGLNLKGGLYSNISLNYDARFVGISKYYKDVKEKIYGPSLKDILKLTRNYVPNIAKNEFEQNLREMYNEY